MSTNKKSIVVICNDFPIDENQNYVFVQQLVNALVDIGVCVNVIAPQNIVKCILRINSIAPKQSDCFTSKGKKYIVYRPYFMSLGNHCRTMANIIRKYSIINVLKKINYDIIYSHFWMNMLPVYKYGLKHKKPLFVACGEGDEALDSMGRTLPLKKRESLKEAVTGIVAVSSENRCKCISYGLTNNDDIIVLPNCVDNSVFFPEKDSIRERYRSELGVEKDDFFVVFVGSFIRRKGADRLSSAIKLLKDDKIKVAFIGKPMRGDSAIPNCIGTVFQGTANHNEIPHFLQAADVFVLPTLKEGCSNAIVEALACGLPVISSDGPFNDDILNENNSMRINPMNIHDIACAIQELKSNKNKYFKMRQYCLSHADQYSIVERAQKIYKFISVRSL